MIRFYFGNIRCGKTTSIIRDIFKRQNHKSQVCFANFDNDLCFSDFDFKRVGLDYTFPPGSHVHIDESGIDFNNRFFKSLPVNVISYLKKSGHFEVDIDFWSQAVDVDITIIRLAEEVWHVFKLGPFTCMRKYNKKVWLNEETHQFEYGFFRVKFYRHFLPKFLGGERVFDIYLRKPYYNYFDTHEHPDLPILSYDGNLINSSDYFY